MLVYLSITSSSLTFIFFFFNDTATTEIYTLSLHDALPISLKLATGAGKTTVIAMLIAWQTVNAVRRPASKIFTRGFLICTPDRKSTRLNSSHSQISYAVFCLKKKLNANANLT